MNRVIGRAALASLLVVGLVGPVACGGQNDAERAAQQAADKMQEAAGAAGEAAKAAAQSAQDIARKVTLRLLLVASGRAASSV